MRGFSLIELLVTLIIGAILLSAGIPSLKSSINNNRQTAILNEFTTYFNYAKSEAVKRGTPVTLCQRNTTGTNCDNSASWNDGWIVFIDTNADGDVDDDGDTNLCVATLDDDCVLKIHDEMASDISIASPLNRVTIEASGFTSLFNTSFTFCDSRGVRFARAKILTKTGSIRSSADTNHNGIHEDDQGNNLTCT
ncbi:MAG: GspH/FimT family pseudopilin [Methylococcaceae bacterium]